MKCYLEITTRREMFRRDTVDGTRPTEQEVKALQDIEILNNRADTVSISLAETQYQSSHICRPEVRTQRSLIDFVYNFKK